MNVVWKIRILIKMARWNYLRNDFYRWRDEIWRRDPDERYCCGGDMCGCMGVTVREMADWEGS